MARPLATRNKKKRPLDVAEFLSRIKAIIKSKDEFTLGIYKSLYPKFPRLIKKALREEGLSSQLNEK